MLHKLVTFEVRGEALDKALALIRDFVDEVGRKEGGTASYVSLQDMEAPTRFTHYMVFRVPSAEDYHKKTAWHKRFHEQLAPLCTRAPEEQLLRPVTKG